MVEGRDDRHVLLQLCSRHGVPESFKIQDQEGKPKLLTQLPVQLKASHAGDVLGVIVDANGDLDATWTSIRNRLSEVGYTELPDRPDPSGPIIEPPLDSILARVGIWIMPNNRDPGTLEDFLLALLPAESPLLQHAHDSIDAIPAGHRFFSDAKRPKALMHTYLAWKEEPGRPYGTAIKAGYLIGEAAPAAALVEWMKRLFQA